SGRYRVQLYQFRRRAETVRYSSATERAGPGATVLCQRAADEREFELQFVADIVDAAELARLQHAAGIYLVALDRHRQRWTRLCTKCLATKRQHEFQQQQRQLEFRYA